MFSRSWRRLIVSKMAVESYMDYLQNTDRELPALSEILPKHQANSKDLQQFHSLLCEVMQENGFGFMGIKVVPPSAGVLQCLRWTDAVCVPIFSNAFQKTTLSAKQQRVQFVEPLFVLRLGRDAPSQLTVTAAPALCDVFRSGVEFTGSRFPYYPPHATGFAADLGGCISIHLGDEMELTKVPLDVMENHFFVLTRKNEPLQVGSGKNCMGSSSAAVALAVAYAASIGKPLRAGHYVFCSGLSSRSPALPGEYRVNYGVYGDNWLPEDKLLISVREDDEVKASLPNIMKKLYIKQMGAYKLYHTIGERKCDYQRPIDLHFTWKQMGISGGGVIYLSKKEPPPVEEITNTSEGTEFKDGKNVFVDIPAVQGAADIPVPFVQSVTEEQGVYSPVVTLISPRVMTPIRGIISEATATQALTQPLGEHAIQSVQQSSAEAKEENVVLGHSGSNTAQTKRDNRSPVNPTQGLPENRPNFNDRFVSGSALSPDVNYLAHDSLYPLTPIVQEEDRMGRVERDMVLRRSERTAYVVSLFEFAHLELQRQRRRAEELRRGAPSGVSCPRLFPPKPLYRI